MPRTILRAFIFSAALSMLHASLAFAEWLPWEDALALAQKDSRFLLVVYDPPGISSRWRRGPAFIDDEVRALLASDFAQVRLNPTEDSDARRAEHLGMQVGSMFVFDADQTKLDDWSSIVDPMPLAEAIKALISSQGTRPSPRDVTRLERDLETAQGYRDDAQIARCIQQLQRITESGFRSPSVSAARRMLAEFSAIAKTMIENAQKSVQRGQFGHAMLIYDAIEDEYDKLPEGETAKDLKRELLRAANYREWKTAADAKSSELWQKLTTAETEHNAQIVAETLRALQHVENPSDARRLSSTIARIGRNNDYASAIAEVLEAENRECERLMAEAASAEESGNADAARAAYRELIGTYPASQRAQEAWEKLEELR
ncbi:MAG: hypothetical protein NUW37_07105 [Planctomycetes bacterium]|nr:hypothetical protein [Planctomycetota bacterium]